MKPVFYNSIEPYWENWIGGKKMKKWYHSRILWVDFLAVAGCIIAGVFSKDWLDGETQVMVLAIIDFILRLKTNQGLEK